jgi:hypothetical protein
MTPVFARSLQVAGALIGIALLGATLAPAQVSRSQPRQASVPLPREAPAPHLRFSQPTPATPLNGGMPAAQTAPQAPAVPAPVEQATPLPPNVRISQTQLNMLRTVPEQIGHVPNHFFWIRQNLQAVRDPVDGALVFLNDEGRVLGRASLPNGFEIREIVADAGQIRLINADREIAIQRSIDPAGASALQDAPVVGNGEARLLRLTRRGPQHLTLQDDRRAGSRVLDVRSVAGGHLAQAYEVGPGSGDNRYVVSEEIVGAKPTLQVRVFVQRFDRDGKLSGVAYVTLDGMDAVPRDFIAVTGDGVLRVLVPLSNGVKIREIAFSAPPRGKSLSADQLKSLGRVLREIAVDSNVTGDNSTPFQDGGQHVELDVSAPPIRRDVVLANARAYLTVNWVMRRENFSRSGIENLCDPARSYVWLRPRRFTEDMIGATIGPMPYRWGGEDTPASFRIRTEWGALAGNLCTCRQAEYNYCIFADSAGVDCSGFVSRAWGIEKRGTVGLLDVATDVDSLEALKPGDAFDWPQRHIRLFTGLAPGAATAITVLEASTRYECEGACERVYRPSEMNGYKLIRYKGISETNVASNGNAGAKPNGAAAPNGKRVVRNASNKRTQRR